MLAGVVKSPSKLAPTRNFAAAERRAQVVLAAMVDADLVKDKDTKIASIAPPKIVSQIAGGSATMSLTMSRMRWPKSSVTSRRMSLSKPRSMPNCRQQPRER